MRVKMTTARPTSSDPRTHRSLTPGELYFVIGINHVEYRVIDDRGEPILFPKDLFEVLDRAIPPGWVLFEDEDAYYLDPAATSRPGFFEQWFGSSGDDADRQRAREALHRALVEMRSSVDAADAVVIDRDLNRLVSTSLARAK